MGFGSSGTGNPADRANGDEAAVSRERVAVDSRRWRSAGDRETPEEIPQHPGACARIPRRPGGATVGSSFHLRPGCSERSELNRPETDADMFIHSR